MIEKKYEDPFEKEPCASCKSKWINVMDGGGYYCCKYNYDIEKCDKIKKYSVMTLDEAIKHYEEIGYSPFVFQEGKYEMDYIKEQCKYKEEHMQLAEWLKELKRYRENE